MNIRPRTKASADIQTSALNDVLFILLFFFLIIATLANPNVIKLMNPKASSDSKVNQSVVVSIDADQKLFVGTQAVSELEIIEAIKAELAKSDEAEPTIVINADKLATADQIVAVMRAAQSLKIKTVLAVAKPD